MKKLCIPAFIFFIVAVNCGAQNRTNVWELGYNAGPGTPKCELRYQNGIMDTTTIYRVMSITNANVSICDTSGNLLFYSNGLTIGNRNYDTLLNAINFNPGGITDFYEPNGSGLCQPMLILPDPGNDQRYYIFHESGEYFTAYNTFQSQPMHLSYSVIDMQLDGGMGGIVDSLKNKYAIVDTMLQGGLTAVKHANGRDWWIIAHNFYHDKYYKLLLTPDGLQGPFEQNIGSNLMYDVCVQANFSPDGSKYCISNHSGWFDYFNFDRCTGEFSNPVQVFNPDSTDQYFFGSSFSPNSRFLYVSSLLNLYQYDTWDTNWIDNPIHIAAWDSFYFNYAPVLFFMHQLAPDGKTYISTWNGSLWLNVINSPDSSGLACDFEPHSFQFSFPEFNNNLPSFPNYDLGALAGSPCDTLNFPVPVKEASAIKFSLSPNPASTQINIVYSITQTSTLTITDAYGRVIKQLTLYPYFKNRVVYLEGLAQGVYLVSLQGEKERVSQKLIVGY